MILNALLTAGNELSTPWNNADGAQDPRAQCGVGPVGCDRQLWFASPDRSPSASGTECPRQALESLPSQMEETRVDGQQLRGPSAGVALGA